MVKRRYVGKIYLVFGFYAMHINKNVQMQTPLFACMMQPFYATPFKKNMTQWNIVN